MAVTFPTASEGAARVCRGPRRGNTPHRREWIIQVDRAVPAVSSNHNRRNQIVIQMDYDAEAWLVALRSRALATWSCESAANDGRATCAQYQLFSLQSVCTMT